MTYIITATAPTVHQIDSLRAFGMEVKKHLDGSFSAEMQCEDLQEAKDHLRQCANKYFFQASDRSDEKLAEMYADIERGRLTIDAATAYIEEVK